MAKVLQGQSDYWGEFGKAIVDKGNGENALRVDADLTSSESFAITNLSSYNDLKATSMWASTSIQLVPPSPYAVRRAVNIYVNSNSDVYVGDATVSTLTGTPVLGGKYAEIETSGNVYCVTGSQSVQIRILEA